MGYYVSLLARARMHRPEPSVRTIIDFRSRRQLKFLSGEVEDIVEKIMRDQNVGMFELEVYFGKSLDKRYDRLARTLFKLFPAPMFKVFFRQKKDGSWELEKLEPISSKKICETDRETISAIASEYLLRRRKLTEMRGDGRYRLAILTDKSEEFAPSNEKALAKFARAAAAVGFESEFVGKEDFSELNEFDALFIRATTNANNFTYAFARQAEAEGIVVMDDTNSIIRCANKVFQAQLAQMKKIPVPKTVIVHKGNMSKVSKELSFPVIIKQPDSQFSQGVFKASNEIELSATIEMLMKHSDLLIAQEFVPTLFDWRIGIFDRKPLFACKYYMAAKHWQIVNSAKKGRWKQGASETIPVEDVPEKVLNAALKMANSIGDGLYGVDVKETEDGRVVVIEVNDNPNIDSGIEDKVLKNTLYMKIMEGFMERVRKIKGDSGENMKRRKAADEQNCI
jgi:glutathione synthase/RimK-type ligase-like ATP-grasp enzyme